MLSFLHDVDDTKFSQEVSEYESWHCYEEDDEQEGQHHVSSEDGFDGHAFWEQDEVYGDPESCDEWSPRVDSQFHTRYNEISSPLLSHSPRTGEYVPSASRQSHDFSGQYNSRGSRASTRSFNPVGQWLRWERIDRDTGEIEVKGARIGQGQYGQVYDPENHRRSLVAKRFFKPFSRATSTEIRNLEDVGQLRGLAHDVDGAPIAVVYKQPGTKLRHLDRQGTEIARLNREEYGRFVEKASEVVAREVVREAQRTGLRHTDAHPGNVLLEYDLTYNRRGTRVTDVLVAASLIDWGLAEVVGQNQSWDRMYRQELRNAREKFGATS
ncbi:hypothetical protein VKT23_001378 [Stygiomarasmius scandens]|uniref:Protein kinase domain-containing protein n=1 Tax=Marasmiellus scandens TaxID=2682957 RepID=A0ABR1KCU0_9AGAR